MVAIEVSYLGHHATFNVPDDKWRKATGTPPDTGSRNSIMILARGVNPNFPFLEWDRVQIEVLEEDIERAVPVRARRKPQQTELFTADQQRHLAPPAKRVESQDAFEKRLRYAGCGCNGALPDV